MSSVYIVAVLASWVFADTPITRVVDEESGDSACACWLTARSLLVLDCAELESVYRNGSMPDMPEGKLRGTAIVSPGSPSNRAVSRASRVVWQGKVFDRNCGVAVNKFFGVRVIKGQVAPGESWMDGKPALILDYRQTSHVYGSVRDEIRQVAPGLLLGAMYESSCCNAELKRFFILEAQCSCK